MKKDLTPQEEQDERDDRITTNLINVATVLFCFFTGATLVIIGFGLLALYF